MAWTGSVSYQNHERRTENTRHHSAFLKEQGERRIVPCKLSSSRQAIYLYITSTRLFANAIAMPISIIRHDLSILLLHSSQLPFRIYHPLLLPLNSTPLSLLTSFLRSFPLAFFLNALSGWLTFSIALFVLLSCLFSLTTLLTSVFAST